MILVIERVNYIRDLLTNLNFSNINVRDIRIEPVDECSGWFSIEAFRGEYRVVIYESIRSGVVTKYAYSLLRGDVCVLRYDNAPHHRDIPTFPHHKHVFDRIEPLYDSSIENFLREVKRFLSNFV